MSDLAQWIAAARETVAKATPGSVRTAGGYLTTRNPNGSSFVRSVFHLDELGQEVRANYSGPFQAIPFHRVEDAAKAALGWNALPALLDVAEAAARNMEEDATLGRGVDPDLAAALARLAEVKP